MHRPMILFRASLLVAAFGLALAAPALTLSSNLDAPAGDAESVAGTNWVAGAFLNDLGLRNLEKVTLRAEGLDGLTLSLYEDGGFEPSAFRGDLGAGTDLGGGRLAFAGDGLSLEAGTLYWIVAKNATGTTLWSRAADDSGTGSGFVGAWGVRPEEAQGWSTFGQTPVRMSVEVQGVPEPAPLAALGLGALAFARRRRAG